MKVKSLILALLLIITLSGCGNTNELTCSFEEGAVKQTYVFGFDNKDDLNSITITTQYEDEEFAKNMYNYLSLDKESDVKLNGKKIIYKESVESFKESAELTETTKSIIKEIAEMEGMTCK